MGVGKDISLPLLACLQMRVQWNGTHTQLEGVMSAPRNMSGRRPTDHGCGRTALVLGATSAVGRMSGFTVARAAGGVCYWDGGSVWLLEPLDVLYLL